MKNDTQTLVTCSPAMRTKNPPPPCVKADESHRVFDCSSMINQIIRNLAPLNDNPMLDACPHQDMQSEAPSRLGQYSNLIIQVTLLRPL
jgi:hypothetical protein